MNTLYKIRITWESATAGGATATVTDESPPRDWLNRATLSGLLSHIEKGLGCRIKRAEVVDAAEGEIGPLSYRVWHPQSGVEGRLAVVPHE